MRTATVLLLLLPGVVGCTNRIDAFTSECEAFQTAACLPACAPDRDCTDAWRAAAELDTADVLESCIALCPTSSCGAQTFFECGCYAECLRDARPELQAAVLEAASCDRGSVDACR